MALIHVRGRERTVAMDRVYHRLARGYDADADFVAAFGQFEQEPLAEAVMRRGQEENSHGVSPLFFCLQEAVGNILVSTVKDRNRTR
jgi:hypothetical protein